MSTVDGPYPGGIKRMNDAWIYLMCQLFQINFSYQDGKMWLLVLNAISLQNSKTEKKLLEQEEQKKAIFIIHQYRFCYTDIIKQIINLNDYGINITIMWY